MIFPSIIMPDDCMILNVVKKGHHDTYQHETLNHISCSWKERFHWRNTVEKEGVDNETHTYKQYRVSGKRLISEMMNKETKKVSEG